MLFFKKKRKKIVDFEIKWPKEHLVVDFQRKMSKKKHPDLEQWGLQHKLSEKHPDIEFWILKKNY